MIRVWRWLVVVGALMMAGAAHGAGPADYPVPAEPHQVFYLQRSMNSNTIVYTAPLDAAGQLDPDEPVKVFWRRYNSDGALKDLTFTERNVAFGVRSKKVRKEPGTYVVKLVSYSGRSALLRVVNGKPQLVAKVAGRDARLVSAYLHLDESGSLPSITKIDVWAVALDNGEALFESFNP